MSIISQSSNDEMSLPHIYYRIPIDPTREPFQDAIAALVQSDDVVLDVATGIGVLAFMAAPYAKRVYAVEDDRRFEEIIKQALASNTYKERIKLEIVESVYKWIPPEQIDVLLCEVLSTGLMFQPQAPLINHYRQFLKPNGKIIPMGISNLASLTHASFDYYGSAFRYPFRERSDLPTAIPITERFLVNTVDFVHEVPDSSQADIVTKAVANGTINSFRVETYTHLAKDIVINQSHTLCEPIVFPIAVPIEVKTGDELKVTILFSHAQEARDIFAECAEIQVERA